MARAIYKGRLILADQEVPVKFYSAIEPGGVHFRLLHAEDNEPVTQQLYDTESDPARLRLVTGDGHAVGRRYVCPEHGTVISGDDIIRGYEVERDQFVPLTDDELESVAPEKTRDINLERFVALEEISPLLYQRAYFLAPGGSSSKAYRLLAHVMEQTGKAGIATFVMRDKSYVVAILAEHGVLRAETLRFADEIRSPEAIGLPSRSAHDRALASTMTKAIKALADDDIDLGELADKHARKLEALAGDKYRRKRDVVKPRGPADHEQVDESPTPIDLVALLKRRLGQASSGGSARNEGARKSKSRAETTRRQALENRPKRDLYARAKSLGIEGRSQMSKEDLVKAIRAAAG